MGQLDMNSFEEYVAEGTESLDEMKVDQKVTATIKGKKVKVKILAMDSDKSAEVHVVDLKDPDKDYFVKRSDIKEGKNPFTRPDDITNENPLILIFQKGGLAGQMPLSSAARIYELNPRDVKSVAFALVKAGPEKKIDVSKMAADWYKGYKADKLPNPGKLHFALSKWHAKEIIGEGTESLDEAKTMAQRLKMKQAFRKNKAKIALGRKKAGRKLADKDTLMKRARKHARDLLVKKLTKGKDKSELSFAQRQNIEKQVDKKSGAIDRIARKLLPKIRQADKDKLKKNKSA